MSGAAAIQPENINEADIMYDEIEEDSKKANGLIYNTIYEAGEKFAGTYVGQYATGKVDRLLKLVEDTAKWSLPQGQDKNEPKEPLERPLPWIPFIGMILVLRFVRLSLSIAGLLIGNAPILPTDVVYFIQTRRRKLRAIRISGMRDIRNKEQARGQKSTGLVSKLRSMLAVVVCKPGQVRDTTKPLEYQNSQEGANKINEINFKENSSSFKRKAADDESCSDQDLTLDQIIDKYGNASSDDDSDFKPPENVLSRTSCSSESTSSATSDDNDDDDDEEIQHSNEATNIKLDAHFNNGNREHQSSLNATKNQTHEKNMSIKENGEHVDKQSYKPVPMPKPQKKEHVPIPIHEIKQEPTESDEERQQQQQQQREEEELKGSTKQAELEQKSVVAPNDQIVKTHDPNQNQCLNNDQMENMNGDGHPQIDHKSEEVFLTPATSNEDLFYSPVGSPCISSDFGFQPTSILKNPNAVYLERRGPEVVYQEQNIEKQEMTNEDHKVSKPVSAVQQPHRGGNSYGGKPNKNKLRGKRR